MKNSLFIVFFYLLLQPVVQVSAQVDGKIFLSSGSLKNNEGRISLLKNWKYHSGDNPAWASPEFDDSAWQTVDTRRAPNQRPESGWMGVGWFRLHLSVDSTLRNTPLALTVISRSGASDIYLNGALIDQVGRTRPSRARRRPPQIGRTKGPAVEDRPFRSRPAKVILFGDKTDHVIAVRYSNFSEDSSSRGGFRLVLEDLNHNVERRVNRVRRSTSYQMFFTGVPLAFTLLHLFLFLFYPESRENLYYAIFTGCIALRTFLRFHGPLLGWQDSFLPELLYPFFPRFLPIATILMTVAGIRFAYSVFYAKPPKRFWGFLAAGVALGILWGYKHRIGLPIYLYLFAPAACAEMLRVIIDAVFKKKDGAWIIGAGFLAFIFASIYPLLVFLQVLEPVENADYVLLYGILALLISMSVYLSRNFARTNQSLERRLIQVRRLSERTMDQQRLAKEKEIQRRLLEADNSRKTQELEEARKLQLSMLPKNVPTLPNLDIAFAMKTATEVGGDYYDFNLTTDGTLTIAIGDATGHGLNAGIMVAAAKSLFKASVNDPDNLQTLGKISQSLKSMNLQRLHMAMTLVKFQNNAITIAAAGMPPVSIYRVATQSVEEVLLEGMPLGCSTKFQYQQKTSELQPDDTVLLMSDGLPEMLNPEDEMLDYHRTLARFEEVADKTPNEIIEHLFKSGEAWASGRPQDDDITFVVIKVK